MQDQLEIKYQPTSCLLPYARNARTHTDKQIRQVVNSIQSFGFINPVIVDNNNMIVAGHARVAAAGQLGIEIVPTISVDHLSEAEKRAYILADNKIAENAGWDENLLRVELEYLTQIDIDVDVDLTGFEMAEVDILLGASCDEIPEVVTPPLPSPEETVTQPGDLWLLGQHRLICGDCRNPGIVHRLMKDATARMIITDPPYNVPIDGHVCGLGKNRHQDFAMASGEMSTDEFVRFLAESLGSLAQASCDGSLHYIFMDWRHMTELLSAGREVYDSMVNLCVWAKTNGGMGSLYRSQHELVLIFKKGQSPHLNNIELGKHGRYRTNVWTYPGVNSFSSDRDEALAAHPTVKPIKLVADAILDVTKRGDVVLDGFLGSGTTLLAAEQTGRICHGIEIDPRYIDVALKRWIHASGEQPIHAESKYTFNKLLTENNSSMVKEA